MSFQCFTKTEENRIHISYCIAIGVLCGPIWSLYRCIYVCICMC